MRTIATLLVIALVFATGAAAQDFASVAGGEKDATSLFQAAMDAKAAAGGGVVDVPTGRYRFDGALTVPTGVTLRGTYAYAPSHPRLRGDGPGPALDGAMLQPFASAGDENAAPFITINGNAAVQGFCIYYPAQKDDAPAPIPYPFTVVLRGNNPAIENCELVNPYKAIDASKNQRALVRNIHGQPIALGVFVDTVYDIGRIENVHWNPWWSMNTPIYQWQVEHGVAFEFARTDWHYVLNTFCFGYNIGYKFRSSKDGAPNGNFLGIGADDCFTAVVVEATQPMGLQITNGEFTAFHGPDPAPWCAFHKDFDGAVRFVNCAFWGPTERIAVVDGHGVTGFSDCSFMQWDSKRSGRPAIDAAGGSLIVRGCDFMEDKAQIYLGKRVDRAVITDNLFNGKKRIKKDARGTIIIKDNAASPASAAWREQLDKAPGFRAHSRRQAAKEVAAGAHR
jgi:hypothetical protein